MIVQDEEAAERRLAEAKRPTPLPQPSKRALDSFDSDGEDSISEVSSRNKHQSAADTFVSQHERSYHHLWPSHPVLSLSSVQSDAGGPCS